MSSSDTRNQFAAHALQGLLANPVMRPVILTDPEFVDGLSAIAFAVADAMLRRTNEQIADRRTQEASREVLERLGVPRPQN